MEASQAAVPLCGLAAECALLLHKGQKRHRAPTSVTVLSAFRFQRADLGPLDEVAAGCHCLGTDGLVLKELGRGGDMLTIEFRQVSVDSHPRGQSGVMAGKLDLQSCLTGFEVLKLRARRPWTG
jgi:hypothetical protein